MNNQENKKECQGNCIPNYGTHHVDLFEVEVFGFGKGALHFIYCANAIKHDRNNKFTVKKIKRIKS